MRLAPCGPLRPQVRRIPGEVRFIPQVVCPDGAATAITGGKPPPVVFQGLERRLIGVVAEDVQVPGPLRHAFPGVGTRGVDVEPRFVGEVEELIEPGQPCGIEFARLGIEGTEGDEDPHDIGALSFQAGKVATRGLGIELFPQLRRPARAGAVVGHSEGHEGFAAGIEETAIRAINADLRRRLFGRLRLGPRGRRLGAAHAQHEDNDKSLHIWVPVTSSFRRQILAVSLFLPGGTRFTRPTLRPRASLPESCKAIQAARCYRTCKFFTN